MISLLSFFSGGIGRWVALSAGVLVALFIARLHWMQEGREDIIAANVKAATRIVTLQGKVTTKIVNRYVVVAAKTEQQAQETQTGVTEYAKQNPNGMCIDASFIRLLNGATGANPATTGPVNDTVPTPAADASERDSQGRFIYGDAELRQAQQVRGYIRRPAGMEQAAS